MIESLLLKKVKTKTPPGELPLNVSTRIDTMTSATCVDLNYDGTKCLISVAYVGPTDADAELGYVAVYNLERGVFKRAQTIYSPEAGPYFGGCAIMSVNGDYIGVTNDAGKVFIYKYDDDTDKYLHVQTFVGGAGNFLRIYFTRDSGDLIVSNTDDVSHYILKDGQFELVGVILTGYRSGTSLSATDDKNLLVVGSPYTNTSGEIILYRRVNDKYEELRKLGPASINGADLYGYGCAISGDGTVILGGMPYEAEGAYRAGGLFGWTVDPATYSTKRTFTKVVNIRLGHLGYSVCMGVDPKFAMISSPFISSTDTGGYAQMIDVSASGYTPKLNVLSSSIGNDGVGRNCSLSHNGMVGITNSGKSGVYVARRAP